MRLLAALLAALILLGCDGYGSLDYGQLLRDVATAEFQAGFELATEFYACLYKIHGQPPAHFIGVDLPADLRAADRVLNSNGVFDYRERCHALFRAAFANYPPHP